MRVARALLSVSDKTGIVDFARTLSEQGVALISTGGTARILRENGLSVQDVSELTEYPEMMDGRVKTLHPRVHGGILARRGNEGDAAAMEANGILPIDLVVVNLYPFEETVAKEGVTRAEAIEQIDIGGPTLLRSSAKNHDHVLVVCDPTDYGRVGEAIASDSVSLALRQELATKVFASTSAYDAAIVTYLQGDQGAFPQSLRLGYEKERDLRYGENPHQSAAFYRATAGGVHGLAAATLHQGKALSYNNLVDADAAYALAQELPQKGVAIIKHTNPCGVGIDDSSLLTAYQRALEGDPISAFGGIVAVNGEVDEALAAVMTEIFIEVVIAPSFTESALAVFERKKNLRVLSLPAELGQPRGPRPQDVAGGLLLQDRDSGDMDIRNARVATERPPTEDEWQALQLAWIVCKHTKSNAIVYANAVQAVGVGAGQMSRIDSSRLGKERAQISMDACVAASDAFFPFRDGLDAIAQAGATAIVQPGGSKRDEEVIAAANEHGVAMVMTGVRHFKH